MLVSILGIIILVLRRLPEADSLDRLEASAHERPQRLMAAKGLPAQAASRSIAAAKIASGKAWRFVLEAKGLKQNPAITHKINKLWRKRPASSAVAPTTRIDPNRGEMFYLEEIKKFPKALENYSKLWETS